MPFDPTLEPGARARYAEMVPHYEPHRALPELERVPPHGRLRVKRPPMFRQTTWTFPAHAAETRTQVAENVGRTVASWGLLGEWADRLGTEASRLSTEAAASPGARQVLTVALDGARIILGAVSLTEPQDVSNLLEFQPHDPGVVAAARERPQRHGALDLPAGPGLYTVVEIGELAAPGSALPDCLRSCSRPMLEVSSIAATTEYPEYIPLTEQAFREAAPLVEDVTGLPLPGTLTLHFATKKAFVFDVIAEQRRLLEHDVDKFQIRESEACEMWGLLAMREGHLAADAWKCQPSRTVVTDDGELQVLIMPSSLHHQAASQEDLAMLAALELAYAARHHASNGRFTHICTTAYPISSGTHGYPAFAEVGHAAWCAREVVGRQRPMAGEAPFGSRSGCGAFSCRVAEAKQDAVEGLPLREEFIPGRSPYFHTPEVLRTVGAGWTAEVVAEGGLAHLNRAWAQVELLPTVGEISDPLAWVERVRTSGEPASP